MMGELSEGESYSASIAEFLSGLAQHLGSLGLGFTGLGKVLEASMDVFCS
jgi:hypothetical protein